MNRGSGRLDSRQRSVSTSITEGKNGRGRRKGSRRQTRFLGLAVRFRGEKSGPSWRIDLRYTSRREPSLASLGTLSCVKAVGFGQSRSIRERERRAATETAEARRREPRRAERGRGAVRKRRVANDAGLCTGSQRAEYAFNGRGFASRKAGGLHGKMSSLDYLDLCRLCLVKDRVSVPIFEGEGDVRQICLKITACLPVKVRS